MKKYRYIVNCSECQAGQTPQPQLNSTLGTDTTFDKATERIEYTYETNTPLHIGELISTAGWGCYEVRAIIRIVDAEPNPRESENPVLKDKDDGDQITLYVKTQEVDYARISLG